MSMTDEEYESALAHFIPEIKDKIRARDTAQREALARYKTVLDGLPQDAMDGGWTAAGISKRLKATEQSLARVEAQLAEALGLLAVVVATNELQRAEAILHGNIEGFLDRINEGKQQEICPVRAAREALLARKSHAAQAEQQEAQGAQSGEFQREDRYLVIKRKDLDLLSPADRDLALTLMGELSTIMDTWNAPKRQYVVVEGDWPEFEPTWAAIQARVEGLATQPDERGAEHG